MKLELEIEKAHQEVYDYDYYVVKFKGKSYRFEGMLEDVLANLEQDLLHLKATRTTNKK